MTDMDAKEMEEWNEIDRQKMINSGFHSCPNCNCRMSDKKPTCPQCGFYDDEEMA